MQPDSKMIRAVYFEDDERTIDLVRLSLRREGIEVIGITDSRDALAVADQHRPDLILLDLLMPGVDGWDVFQALKDNLLTAETPIIVITAKARGMDKALGLHIARVAAYITKPFSPTELVQHVRKVLAATSA